MTGMTPERLDAIRANLPTPDADLSRRERDAHDLLAEVDRLTDELATAQAAWDEWKARHAALREDVETRWAFVDDNFLKDILHSILKGDRQRGAR